MRPFGQDVTARMRPLTVVGAVLIAIVAPPATAQEREGATTRDPACDSPEAHQFDFWIGDWDVKSRLLQSDGSWRETSETWTARSIIGGCAIQDFAEGDFGIGGMNGFGLRFYDPTANEWTITWMSTGAPGRLGVWTGTMGADGGDFHAGLDGENASRIRWYDVSSDFARWEYATSTDQGGTWRTGWTMEFRRRVP